MSEKTVKELILIKDYIENHRNETNVITAEKMGVSKTTIQRLKNENTKKMKAIGNIWREIKNKNIENFSNDEAENIFRKYFQRDKPNSFTQNRHSERKIKQECLECIRPEEILKITFGNQKIAWANIIKIACIFKKQPDLMTVSVSDYLNLSTKTVARIRNRESKDYEVIDKFIKIYNCDNICKMNVKEIHEKLYLNFFNNKKFPGVNQVSEENLNKLFNIKTLQFIKENSKPEPKKVKKIIKKKKKISPKSKEEIIKDIFDSFQERKDNQEVKKISKRNVKILGTYNSSDTIKKLANYYGCEIRKKSVFGDRYFDNIIENSKFQRM